MAETKVASVAEEIRNPDRNIPLGMLLSLATAAVVYTVGVFIITAVLPPETLRDDLKPVATATEAFATWLPISVSVGLIVVAAQTARCEILYSEDMPHGQSMNGVTIDNPFMAM